jgi:uncharacterized protein YsxB (DUF464 family)
MKICPNDRLFVCAKIRCVTQLQVISITEQSNECPSLALGADTCSTSIPDANAEHARIEMKDLSIQIKNVHESYLK